VKKTLISLALAALFSTGAVARVADNQRRTYDNALLLKAAGLVAASAAGATILDLGAGFVDAEIVIDATAVEVATGDEKYVIVLEASNTADMSAGSVTLVEFPMGIATAPMDATVGVGRYMVPFTNEQNGTMYRYCRIYTRVSGTIATGINYSAFIAKR
jgi:hypothetical protein